MNFMPTISFITEKWNETPNREKDNRAIITSTQEQQSNNERRKNESKWQNDGENNRKKQKKKETHEEKCYQNKGKEKMSGENKGKKIIIIKIK